MAQGTSAGSSARGPAGSGSIIRLDQLGSATPRSLRAAAKRLWHDAVARVLSAAECRARALLDARIVLQRLMMLRGHVPPRRKSTFSSCDRKT